MELGAIDLKRPARKFYILLLVTSAYPVSIWHVIMQILMHVYSLLNMLYRPSGAQQEYSKFIAGHDSPCSSILCSNCTQSRATQAWTGINNVYT